MMTSWWRHPYQSTSRSIDWCIEHRRAQHWVRLWSRYPSPSSQDDEKCLKTNTSKRILLFSFDSDSAALLLLPLLLLSSSSLLPPLPSLFSSFLSHLLLFTFLFTSLPISSFLLLFPFFSSLPFLFSFASFFSSSLILLFALLCFSVEILSRFYQKREQSSPLKWNRKPNRCSYSMAHSQYSTSISTIRKSIFSSEISSIWVFTMTDARFLSRVIISCITSMWWARVASEK